MPGTAAKWFLWREDWQDQAGTAGAETGGSSTVKGQIEARASAVPGGDSSIAEVGGGSAKAVIGDN
jgi:hypothetical protein